MLTGAAMAQTDDADVNGARTLEEVTVFATRTGETDLQTTPIAVTALNSEAIQKLNIENLQDVANFTPSLQITAQAGRAGAAGSVTIRGIGGDARESQAAVGTYIDDVYFASGFGNILGLLDVAQVEVLRGPQGTVFGRNTIAGAIQYRSTKPGDDLSGYARGTVGNYNRTDLEAAITLPVHETLSIRVAGMANSIDGYVDNLSDGGTQGDNETDAARIRAVWTPSDRLSVDLKAETISVEQEGRNNIVTAINPNAQFPFLAANGLFIPGVPGVDLTGYDDSLVLPFNSPDDYAIAGVNDPEIFDFEYTVYQGSVTYDLSENLTLKSITAKIDSETEFLNDFDQTTFPILETQLFSELEAFSQEFQLSGNAFDNRLNFVTGLYYYDSDDLGSTSSLVGIGFLPPGGITARVENESIAAFAQGTFDLNERLSISAGLRYTDETVTTSVEEIPNSDAEFEFNDVSPQVGVNYQASDDVFLYAKASKGFRAGGQIPVPSLPEGAVPYDPEEAWTYEIGARMTFGDVLRINPTIFYTDWSDLQATVILFLPAPTVTLQNVADVEIYGLELEGEWFVTDAFTVNFSGAWTEASYKEVFPIVSDNGAGITTDSDLAGTPELSFALGGDYYHQLASNIGLNLNVSYSYIGEQRSFLQSPGAIQLDSYGLLGARAQFDFGDDFSLAIFGTNLTDEVYLLGGQDYAGGATAGHLELNVGRGRAYGIEGKFTF